MYRPIVVGVEAHCGVADPVRGAGCIGDGDQHDVHDADVADPVRGAGCIKVQRGQAGGAVLEVADPVRGAGCIGKSVQPG